MGTEIWQGVDMRGASSYWWAVLLRGVVAVLFGIAVFSRPIASAAILLLLFGAFALTIGALLLIAGLAEMGRSKHWWALMAEGMVSIVVGLITFYWPGITAVSLLWFVGSWALITGVLQIAAAFVSNRDIGTRVLFGISGLLSLVLGIYLFARPGAGMIVMIFAIGIYALAFGVAQIVLGLRLNRAYRTLEGPTP